MASLGYWGDTLVVLVIEGKLSPSVLAARPEDLLEGISEEFGPERPEIPLPLQEAVCLAVERLGMKSEESSELLETAATYSDLTPALESLVVRKRTRQMAKVVAENPTASARMAVMAVRAGDVHTRRMLLTHPALPVRERLELMAEFPQIGEPVRLLTSEDAEVILDRYREDLSSFAPQLLQKAWRPERMGEWLRICVDAVGMLGGLPLSMPAEAPEELRVLARSGDQGMVRKWAAKWEEAPLPWISIREAVEKSPEEALPDLLLSYDDALVEAVARRVEGGAAALVELLAGERYPDVHQVQQILAHTDAEEFLTGLASLSSEHANLVCEAMAHRLPEISLPALEEILSRVGEVEWSVRSLLTSILDRHGREAWGLVRPAVELVGHRRADPVSVGRWLSEELSASEVEVFWSLLPGWQGNVASLLDAARELGG